jgi:hypothetical protein
MTAYIIDGRLYCDSNTILRHKAFGWIAKYISAEFGPNDIRHFYTEDTTTGKRYCTPATDWEPYDEAIEVRK